MFLGGYSSKFSIYLSRKVNSASNACFMLFVLPFILTNSICFILSCSFSHEATLLCSILCRFLPGFSRNIEIIQQGFKDVIVLFLLVTLRALSFLKFSIKILFGSHLCILVTWPVYLSCDRFDRECTLCIIAFFRTSVSGILPCSLILRVF